MDVPNDLCRWVRHTECFPTGVMWVTWRCLSQRHTCFLNILKIRLNVNANKTELMCFKQEGAITTLSGWAVKLVDQFIHLIYWKWCQHTPNDGVLYYCQLSITGKSNLSDNIKWEYFQAVSVSVLQYECTTWMLAKRL